MKKSILIFAVALFASITSVYAQPPADPCEPWALRPAAGVEYLYQVEMDAPYTGLPGHYFWYITQDVNLLNYGSILPQGAFFTVAEGYYNIPAAPPAIPTGGPTINITWTAEAVTSSDPFYLVIQYFANAPGSDPTCIASNIRVWQIDPLNNFLLEIVGVQADGSAFPVGTNPNTCPAEVTGALVTPGSPSGVTYTYGVNSLYFKVTASGIVGDWRASVSLPALLATQNYVNAWWSYTPGGQDNAFPGVAGSVGPVPSQSLVAVTIPEPPAGQTPSVDIYIRVDIAQNQWQSAANQVINLAIDGHYGSLWNVSDIWGLGNEPGGAAWCDEADVFAKNANYTIIARPQPNAVTPIDFIAPTNP